MEATARDAIIIISNQVSEGLGLKRVNLFWATSLSLSTHARRKFKNNLPNALIDFTGGHWLIV